MSATRTTLLNALKEASQTGKIEIKSRTATILTHMVELDEAVNTLFEDFTCGVAEGEADRIGERLFDAYSGLKEVVRAETMAYLQESTFGEYMFNGL